jgi:hypothetical protein
MLIHDGGGGDGPTVDAHTYEKLTVSELEQALHVDAGAITTAADQWGNLHDVLDDFLGKTIPGPDAFPVLVATLNAWHGKAADEFRNHADDITKLATEMMTKAGQERDGQAATFHLVTGDVHDTLSSAQTKVLRPLHDGWQKWKHLIKLLITDMRYLGGNRAFFILIENGQAMPTRNDVSTPDGDTVSFYPLQAQNTHDGPVVQFVFQCTTSRYCAYEPYVVFGQIEVRYFPGTDYTYASIRDYGPVRLTAWNPITGQDRPGETYTAPSPGHVNESALMATFDDQNHSAYKDQLVTLANAVGYLYQYRMKQLPDPPQPTSPNSSGGPTGPGVPPLGPSLFDHNGLVGPDAFSPTTSNPPLLPLSDVGSNGQLAGLGRDPALFTPGAGSGLGLETTPGPLGVDGLGALTPGTAGLSTVDGAGLAGAGVGSGAGAGLGRGMLPMAPGAGMNPGQGGKERSRQSWLSEDESVWGTDGDEPGPVL